MINDRDFVKIRKGKIYKDDYIKRKDVIALAWNAICEDEWHMHRLDKVVSVSDIAKLPSADVAERKHGKWGYRWKVHGGGRRPTELFPCSECGYENTSATNFCPNCGARMETDTFDDNPPMEYFESGGK